MTLVGAVLFMACAWLGGRAMLPSREKLGRSLWEEQCVAYLLGTAALALAAMAITWAGSYFTPVVAWSLLLISGAARRAWPRTAGRPRRPCRCPSAARRPG
jgi:hypothetical protein